MLRRTVALAAVVALAGAIPGLSSTAGAARSAPTPAKPADARVPAGSFALGGDAADAFRLPSDVVRVHRSTAPGGGTSTRYQQVVDGAAVLNGQITVVRGADGSRAAVIGAYYPGLTATNSVKVAVRSAVATAARVHGAAGAASTDLRIDPRDGRLFYIVDQIRSAKRWVTWVDAGSGNVSKTYNALAEGEGVGIGVKGDRKRFETRRGGGVWELRNADGNGVDIIGDARRVTETADNKVRLRGPVLRDDDNRWYRTRPNYRSPDQRPGVDAHYYSGVVDSFYADVFGRNSLDDEGMQLRSVVHFARGYCNAFWNGEQMTYGDGFVDEENDFACLALSGGLDVVGHELTHGVTEFTSNLIYEDESGALNESFSDIIGNTVEFYAQQEGLDPAARPDWRIGEDVIIGPGRSRGFRNMGDPAEFGDPDHYTERYRGPQDNGGVHINSGISNHAYYLAVNGGRNAGCAGSASGHTHQRNCSRNVDAIGLNRSRQIFYQAYTGLTEYANMCDARNATVALAGYQGVQDSVSDAWAAVGVLGGCRPGVPPPPPCLSDGSADLPFGSPHPYGNNADCTWIHDNGSGGFRFRFSLLDTEENFDYVYVRDGNGRLLNTYTGTYDAPVLSACIPTRKGIVQLVSDGSVTARGFTVDATTPC